MVSLDGKGRIVIPARQRAQLVTGVANRVYITADPLKCLMLYTVEEWGVLSAKLAALSDFHPTTRSIKAVMLGHAHEFELDTAGRVQLPPQLTDYAGLAKNVVVAGMGNRIELWDSERWQAHIGVADAAALQTPPPELQGFTL